MLLASHAQFLMKIVDVTDKVNEKIKDIPALELTQKLPGILAEMANKETEGFWLRRTHCFNV
jgi:hypothetical protein